MSDYTPEEANAIYKDIKERISARWDKRGEFMIHLMLFGVTAIIYLFADKSSWSSGVLTAANIFMVLWLAGFMAHIGETIFFELRERAIDREVDRLGLRHALYQKSTEKAKRESGGQERLVRLSEDGELVDVEFDDAESDNAHVEKQS